MTAPTMCQIIQNLMTCSMTWRKLFVSVSDNNNLSNLTEGGPKYHTKKNGYTQKCPFHHYFLYYCRLFTTFPLFSPSLSNASCFFFPEICYCNVIMDQVSAFWKCTCSGTKRTVRNGKFSLLYYFISNNKRKRRNMNQLQES